MAIEERNQRRTLREAATKARKAARLRNTPALIAGRWQGVRVIGDWGVDFYFL